MAQKIRSRFVIVVTVTDPDSNLPVDVEIRKLENGAMMGIDASYLDQDVGPVYSPFDRNMEVCIPDDE
jgi:hypothetical protein